MTFESQETAWAFLNGYKSFTGDQMLREVGSVSHCPYTTEIYVEAYRNGFHAAASMYLMEKLAVIARLPRQGIIPLTVSKMAELQEVWNEHTR